MMHRCTYRTFMCVILCFLTSHETFSQKYKEMEIQTAKGGSRQHFKDYGIEIEREEVIFELKMCGDAVMDLVDEADKLIYFVHIYYKGLSTSTITFCKKDRIYERKEVKIELACDKFHKFKVLWLPENTGVWLKEKSMWKALYYIQDTLPFNYTVSDINLTTHQGVGIWKIYKIVHTQEPAKVNCTYRGRDIK